MDLTHATAGDMLDRYRAAWLAFDGEAWVDLFSADVVYHDGPFGEPLVGHNAVRAYLLRAAEAQDQLDVAIERHWAVAATIIAVWHASFVQRATRARVRLAGVMTLELDSDGRIARYHQWYHRQEAPGE
jgi:SnoaL-like protein